MARPTAMQARLRFEQRYLARLRKKVEAPEVRDAVQAIRFEAWRLWKAGEPFGDCVPTEPTRGAALFWSERADCHSHGVSVQVEGKGESPRSSTLASLWQQRARS